ncbi:MAG: HEPN domain-containing protein [Candidatus Sumerlaeota bacterium]|nr:HEPN domain-containing protein [Candidatus Sumerlaeota bacterium]
MKPLTREWIAKAEEDFAMLGREMRARKDPSYSGACFHAQQCAEKYLKAYLTESSIPFSKTHYLVALLELALPTEPLWESYREDLAQLSSFAVDFRYPGESADKSTARDAYRKCKSIRQALRESLSLE